MTHPKNTPPTLAQFLGLSEPDEILTEAILISLETLEPLASSSVSTVSQIDAGSIALQIATADSTLKRSSLKIAIALLNRLAEAGYIPEATSDAVPQSQDLKLLRPDLTLDQMGIEQLINVILNAKEPVRKIQAWQYFNALPEVINAIQRSPALARTVNGELDVDGTLHYILTLNDPLAEIQVPKRSEGERYIPLAEAFGVELRPYISPLTGKPLRGADRLGIEWVKVIDPAIHKAAIWGIWSRNPLHPGLDYDAAMQLKTDWKDTVWQQLKHEYEAAIDAGNWLAKNIDIYADQANPLLRKLPFEEEQKGSRSAISVPFIDAESPTNLGDRNQEYQILQQKLTALRRAHAIETSASVKFQLQHQISQTQAAISELEQWAKT
ncbi:hypothetical protein ACQ4M3_08015 [Leptolyngbya sp. AN03gr2]|uniref:hypothetical protein n=1 Tax=unclassified Leptolyngbya TaxID=2650499 RepID=UPI003D31BAE3